MVCQKYLHTIAKKVCSCFPVDFNCTDCFFGMLYTVKNVWEDFITIVRSFMSDTVLNFVSCKRKTSHGENEENVDHY